MQLIETHKAISLEEPIRFQAYGVGIFKSVPTKSGIKKAIKKGLILIDGAPANTAKFIHGGECIELFENRDETQFKRLELSLDVLFEDEYLAIIYKPAGILVSGNKFVTIANALIQNLQKSKQKDAVKPQPIHRLDYPTSGILLVGKTSSSIIALSQLFETKEIQKTYHAITVGKMNTKGSINTSIHNKISVTEYEVLDTTPSTRFKVLNLVQLAPKTGRKHQLRIHLSSIGNQILGDKEYGNKDLILKGNGLYLHASTLEFTHPFSKKSISINKELPQKFKNIFPNYIP